MRAEPVDLDRNVSFDVRHVDHEVPTTSAHWMPSNREGQACFPHVGLEFAVAGVVARDSCCKYAVNAGRASPVRNLGQPLHESMERAQRCDASSQSVVESAGDEWVLEASRQVEESARWARDRNT